MNGNERTAGGGTVGQTAAAGFQIGVRRTLPFTQRQVWDCLLSPEGLKLWIGDVGTIGLNRGDLYEAPGGVRGEMRVAKRHEQLRLTWQPSKWARPSTLQIRLLPASGERTTVSFHQEHLDGPGTREEMKLHWEDVIAKIAERLGS